MRGHLVDLEGRVLRETEMALYFECFSADKKVWLPKSQCEWYPEDMTMTMPEWLAIEKELV